MIGRRAFLSLFGAAGVGLAIGGLEATYAEVYERVEPVEFTYLSEILSQTYSTGDFFVPFQRDYTPLLDELQSDWPPEA